jgi:hypothetical protein
MQAVSILNKLSSSNYPILVNQYAMALANSINLVNCCTVAVPCNVLNRRDCSYTAFTCGPCKVGYSSYINEDDNSFCTNTSFNQINYFQSNRKLLDGIRNRCLSDFMCISGISYCDLTDKICKKYTKLCPNSCSGNGVCVYYRYSKIQKFCYLDDFSCISKCNCFNDFYGVDCSLNTSQLVHKIESRNAICKSQLKIQGMQDITLDLLQLRFNLAANAMNDPTEVTFSVLLSCLKFVNINVMRSLHILTSSDGIRKTSASIIRAYTNALRTNSITRIPLDMMNEISKTILSWSSSCR